VTTCRALIVDDERLAREELRYLLRAHPEVQVAAEARTVKEAAAAVETLRPDLVFLDIQMPRESGFELFERVRLDAAVIFVTAHDEFALRAFDVNALDYLMKPVNPTRLAAALDRLRRPRAPVIAPAAGRLAYEDAVFLNVGQGPRFVKLASLVCILAEGDYSRLVSSAGSMGLVLKSMKEWEAILPERQFCRIQRSVIINCERVDRFEPWFNSSYRVYLQHVAEPFTMSRRLAKRFRERFGA
jgi:two-component system, LytTR family, response regulator